jgi:predicted outer membrane repeat protein
MTARSMCTGPKAWIIVASSSLLSAACCDAARGEIINVPDDHPTIQQAVSAANPGDEVVVAEGEYFENINLLGKAITVRSTDPTDPAVVAQTIINAGGEGTVVTCDSGEGPGTVISGFLITNGYAVGSGGGMYLLYSSPSVTYCIFSGNVAEADGGGMCSDADSNPTVEHCTFTDNIAGLRGGGMFNDAYSEPVVEHCTFSDNTAGYRGGGVCSLDAVLMITDCRFIANSAPDGAGMYNEFSLLNVINSMFIANTATTGSGGGMANELSSLAVTNCTFTRNEAADEGGGIYSSYFTFPIVTNCILRGDLGGEIDNDNSSSSHVTYCNVQGGYEGQGNIDADPLFADPDNGDYHLSAGSPCIDAGDNTALPAGILTDLDGNPRFVDDPDTADTGFGAPPIVDMGAYEFQVEESCPADFDEDGDVDTADLLFLLGCWGMPCGDVDFDGDTDTSDLLTLLAAWGECP